MDGGAPDVIVCMITGGGSDIDLETLAKSNVGVDLFILDFDPSPEVYSGGANIQVAPPSRRHRAHYHHRRRRRRRRRTHPRRRHRTP